jgi:hypothetical protein
MQFQPEACLQEKLRDLFVLLSVKDRHEYCMENIELAVLSFPAHQRCGL